MNPTYMDFRRRLDEKDKIAAVIEMLAKTNEMLEDMVVKEGNLVTGHKTTVRTGLPTATWRLLNYGVQPSKSTTKQVTDTCGMLEAYAEVDKALADLNGNTAEFRLSEDRAFLEAMNQEMQETMLYGTSAEEEKFVGLKPRFNSLSNDPNQSGYNIIDAGGTTPSAQTSIWLVVWGEDTVHAIYPKGSKGGFQHEDKGQVTLEDENGGKYEGYRSHYKWDLGLTVRDWRYVVRIANIEPGTFRTAGAPKLINKMIQAAEMIPNLSMGKPVFYARRETRTEIREQIIEKPNVNLTYDTVDGKIASKFGEIPVRRIDALLLNEERVA